MKQYKCEQDFWHASDDKCSGHDDLSGDWTCTDDRGNQHKHAASSGECWGHFSGGRPLPSLTDLP